MFLGLAQIVRTLTMFVSTIVVVRLLTPSDFGVMAMVAPITGFILIFQEMGLGQAVVQRAAINDGQVNALFWCNIAASFAIALLFLAFSPLLILFYGDGRPGAVMALSGLTVLASGLSLQHVALLNRRMRFRALSAIEIVTSLTSLVWTIGLAAWLHSYWALFLGTLAGVIIGSTLSWTLERWRPSLQVSFSGTRQLLSFGANVTGFNILNYLARNADNVLIAKSWGATPLGLYDRSYRLMMFPIQSINQPLARVMLPTLRRVRDDPLRYRRMFLLAIRALSLISVPGIMAGAMCSREVISILLGERWNDAGPIFFWLSLAAVTQPVSNATGWLFMSSDRSRAMMQWGLVSAPVTIAGFAAGLPWGAVGVAAGYFLTQVIRIPLLYMWSTRGTSVRARDLYATLLPTLVGGGIAWAAVGSLRGILGNLALVSIALVSAYSFSIAVQAITAEGREAIAELLRLARNVSMGKRAGNRNRMPESASGV